MGRGGGPSAAHRGIRQRTPRHTDGRDRAGESVSEAERGELGRAIDHVLAESTRSYIAHRDAEVRTERANLEFVAAAAELLSSSLDYQSTLSHLMRLLVPARADWCVLHWDDTSEDGGILLAHVNPALLREIYRDYPPPSEAGYAFPHVFRTGESVLVPSVEPDFYDRIPGPRRQLWLLKTLDATSWLHVPLRVQDRVFGVLTLAFGGNRRRCTQVDVEVATALARHAAFAIDNARLFRQAQRENAKAEAAARERAEFIGVVSHELRTPLNAIRGWASLLRAGTLSESQRQNAAEIIERNAAAQGSLLTDLLDANALFSGRLRIQPADVPLADVVRAGLEGIGPAAAAKRITIQTALEPEAVVRGDAGRLQQVTWSLLSNAVKFTPQGGEVRVALAGRGTDVVLEVSDDGEGIAPDFLPHVFDVLRQADSSSTRTHGGLGIGLTLAKHIVELHGGTLLAMSDGPGRGATFIARLPAAPGRPASPPVSRSSIGPPGSEPSTRGLRALVFDDEPEGLALLEHVLEMNGLTVRGVASIAAALAALSTDPPDFVICAARDLATSGMSFVRSVRGHASARVRAVPVIALSDWPTAQERSEALVAGYNAYLAKPVDADALMKTIADVVGPSSREPGTDPG